MLTKRVSPKPKVLAVDDKPANLIALEAVLADEYEMINAESGVEALAVLQKRQDIDVILMDIQMPHMDGFEAAKRIKALPGCADIPIIFITAVYKEDPFIKKGYAAGAVDYFSKPFDPDILKLKMAVYANFRQKAGLLQERERQVRATEELLKAGRKLSSLLETLSVGVLISDVEGRICQVNEAVTRIFHTSEPMEQDAYGELLGWWDESGRVIKNKNVPLSRALLYQQTSHNQILQMTCLDGTPKTLLCSASPLLGLDQKILGAVIVIQDVTESKQIEEDLENRITKLISLGVELQRSSRT